MQRQEMIDDLVRLTGISREILERMTLEQLEKVYSERVLEKGMI